MSKKIVEVKIDYIDDQNYTFVDAYFDNDINSEGKSICAVCNDTSKVLYFDNRYRGDELIEGAIKEIKKRIKNNEIINHLKEVQSFLKECKNIELPNTFNGSTDISGRNRNLLIKLMKYE